MAEEKSTAEIGPIINWSNLEKNVMYFGRNFFFILSIKDDKITKRTIKKISHSKQQFFEYNNV